ncbi:hypothetical protein GC175_15295 [bacterium]|nr:hypothetical protein [bacterium]
MSDERRRCQAKTQSGSQCKNSAVYGSTYCRTHQDQPEPTPVPTKTVKAPDSPPSDTDVRSEIERFKAFILGK